MEETSNYRDKARSAWRAPAAYLYALALDNSGWAWEYLRRNDVYRAAWSTRLQTVASPRSWDLQEWEDPLQDARTAQPLWYPAGLSTVHLTATAVNDPAATFAVWRIRGHKSLVHDGLNLQLISRQNHHTARVLIEPGLWTGAPYAYRIPAGGNFHAKARAASAFELMIHGERKSKPIIPPDRSAVAHSRTLQAMDGIGVGASHRDVAIALFGDDAVKTRWTPDGELRAQLRYLLKRGRALVGGGYRSLLKPDTS